MLAGLFVLLLAAQASTPAPATSPEPRPGMVVRVTAARSARGALAARGAIRHTRGAWSVTEQFPSDTARLHAAADGLRYNYMGMAGLGGPEVIDSQQPFGAGPSNASPSGKQTSEGHKVVDDWRRQMVQVGTLDALRRIVKGLAPYPGRKPVIVFSEGFKIDRDNGLN